jgi:acylphosphatase
MENLYHLIYASKQDNEFTQDTMIEFIATLRQANKKTSITGMLLCEDGTFFQVIEGDKESLNKLFANIVRDKRHSQVTKIIFEAIPERYFSTWSIGFPSISKIEFSSAESTNDFFQLGTCLSELFDGRAKKLLAAFSDGRWRMQ